MFVSQDFNISIHHTIILQPINSVPSCSCSFFASLANRPDAVQAPIMPFRFSSLEAHRHSSSSTPVPKQPQKRRISPVISFLPARSSFLDSSLWVTIYRKCQFWKRQLRKALCPNSWLYATEFLCRKISYSNYPLLNGGSKCL